MLRSRSTERGGEAGGDGSAEAPGQKRPSRKEEEGRGKVGNDSGGGGHRAEPSGHWRVRACTLSKVRRFRCGKDKSQAGF